MRILVTAVGLTLNRQTDQMLSRGLKLKHNVLVWLSIRVYCIRYNLLLLLFTYGRNWTMWNTPYNRLDSFAHLCVHQKLPPTWKKQSSCLVQHLLHSLWIGHFSIIRQNYSGLLAIFSLTNFPIKLYAKCFPICNVCLYHIWYLPHQGLLLLQTSISSCQFWSYFDFHEKLKNLFC